MGVRPLPGLIPAPLNSLAEKEDEREICEVTFGKKSKRKLDLVMLTQAHTFILHNAECMQSWLEEYERERIAVPRQRERYTSTFLEYMRETILQIGAHVVSSDVKDIVLGPYSMVKSYNTIWCTGLACTVERDETGFTRVKVTSTISRTRRMDEPFVFPTQVEQCFFIPALHMPEWAYVIPYTPMCRQ
ncbi:hypothetical protein R1sor_014193 [Riccia sorocarpa]|uniref:Uncharacterized protein n=1 Tax=Riccia sorocarpa TaxID=122646 RepID=A0ABD3HBK7_9MARC